MKKIAVGVIAILAITLLQPAYAQDKKSIVIIDTAIDTSLTTLKNKVIQEICILNSRPCPNGEKFQEGVGAATLPTQQALSGGFEHGTAMALIANQINPDVNIIFIRIAGVLANGKIDSYSDIEIAKALEWSIQNKQKYNIVSVSASLGNHNLKREAEYCPITQRHDALIQNINKLIEIGVPTMFASGNNRDIVRINFPACIPSAVAVGGTTETGSLSPFFNSGALVDFYVLGTFNTEIKRIVGTSASTVAFSAYWAKNHKGTYVDTYNYMKSVAKEAIGRNTKTNLFVDILK